MSPARALHSLIAALFRSLPALVVFELGHDDALSLQSLMWLSCVLSSFTENWTHCVWQQEQARAEGLVGQGRGVWWMLAELGEPEALKLCGLYVLTAP